MNRALTPPAGRTGSRPARLIIADDHDLARAGLRSVLEDERGLEIVGEANNGKTALSLCRRLQPDLLLLDLRMPDMDGLAVARAVRERCPQTRIVLITMYEKSDYVREAIRAGVSGYVLKYATQAEIVGAVRAALQGGSIATAESATELENQMIDGAAWWPRDRLTPREHEILRLLSRGLTNKEIADNLIISPATVKNHVEHILAKLEVADRTEAAARAAAFGLL